MNTDQIDKSKSLLGPQTVDMLFQVHADSLWILENMGVGCAQPDMLSAFQQHEADGQEAINAADKKVQAIFEKWRAKGLA